MLFQLKEDQKSDGALENIFVENESNQPIKNIIWPKISEFNQDLGASKIDEYIKNVINLKNQI